MASEADILAALQNGVTAINNLNSEVESFFRSGVWTPTINAVVPGDLSVTYAF